MLYLPEAAAMRAADAYTISGIGIRDSVLMERAALAIAEETERIILERGISHPLIVCVCGKGNNGGDGICCARILRRRGYDARIVPAGFAPAEGRTEGLSASCAEQLAIAERMEVPVSAPDRIDDADVLIDALFGTGLSRDVSEPYRSLILRMNDAKAYRIAADIPSGIDADTGRVCGCAVRCDTTVTMEYPKAGLLLFPGAGYAGRIVRAEIGIVRDPADRAVRYVTEEKDLCRLLPPRERGGHKGTFGRVLIFAGSEGMAGAACLCAHAALRSGCGMVRVVTPDCNRQILQTVLPEAMTSCFRSPKDVRSVLGEAEDWADVIACGPGIGQGEAAEEAVEYLLSETEKPLVLDADALNLCARSEGLRALLYTRKRVILTPHAREMSRLTGAGIREVTEDLPHAAKTFAEASGCTVILKSARCVIADPSGGIYVNPSGCDGMATAGSGDVLCGMTASLLARGCAEKEAALAACFLHGMAGEAAQEAEGASGMKASDIVRMIGAVLKKAENE